MTEQTTATTEAQTTLKYTPSSAALAEATSPVEYLAEKLL